jgi:hypothetical protein
MHFTQTWDSLPSLQRIAVPAAVVVSSVVFGLLIYFVLFKILNRIASQTRTMVEDDHLRPGEVPRLPAPVSRRTRPA